MALILMQGLLSCTGVPGPSGTPVITSFNASPPVITGGQSSILTWNVNGATSVTLSPNIGTVGNSGSITVAPSSITTYTLTANNSYGSSMASMTVTVNPLSSPPSIGGFTVNPPVIGAGQSATLTWNVTGSNMVRIDPSVGNVSPSGSVPVSPDATTTYILTAGGTTGVVTGTVTLSVVPLSTYSTSSPYPTYPVYPSNPNETNLPAVISFNMDPPDISPGESTVMTWDVIGADSVSIDNGVGNVPASGSLTLTPGTTTYYQLTATNGYGPVSSSAIVTVYPLNYYYYTPPPVVFPPIRPGGERGEGNDHGGDNSGRVPRIEHFGSDPPKLDVGHPSELQWRVDGATSVDISPDIGSVPPSGKMTVAPTHTTVYTITASNANGVVQHPQEIKVPRTMGGKMMNSTTDGTGSSH